MELTREQVDFERLNRSLNDETSLKDYKAPYDAYCPGLVPRLLSAFLISSGNLVYGREPSYLKFRAIEVIARVPYQSWSSVIYTLQTFCYTNEKRALALSRAAQFSSAAEENETMHVIVVSHLARDERAGVIRHTVIPLLFAFMYFWFSYLLYLVRPRSSFELNYLFEDHAFEQYSRFLELSRDTLEKKPVQSAFLDWYGRSPANQFEFFRSVRNDELIHRNSSIQQISS